MKNARRSFCVVVLVAALLPNFAFGQTRKSTDRSTEEGSSALQDRLLQGASQTATAPIPLESTVDPAAYTVGPSDIFSVNIWMVPPMNFTLTVTPEGTLIIPGVSEIHVSGKTLVQMREAVLSELRRKFPRAEASVTLVRPRPILVNVVGYVQNPGQYSLTAVDRANRAIEAAMSVNRTQLDLPGFWPLQSQYMSLRNVIVRHRDGTETRIDIQRYTATKIDRFNPYLREGDVVVVPQRDAARNVFGIYGAVNVPGRYEVVEGDSVLTALRIAEGFTALALKDSVQLSHLSLDGTTLSTEIIDLGAMQEGRAANIPLHSGDRLVVRSRTDLREDYRVNISGEVRRPGMYPISRDRTKLSEAIRAAGGFTDYAFLRGAAVLRNTVQQSQIALERLESSRGGIASEDSTYYLLETDLRLQKEVVNVDFEKLFMMGDTTRDVILQDEDRITVPSRRATIYVFGQVVNPGHVQFAQNQPFKYYVDKAGGFTEVARPGDVKIVKSKTHQWLSPSETRVEEGDYVWVPKEIERPFGYYLGIVGQTAVVISVGLSIVLLVIQAGK